MEYWYVHTLGYTSSQMCGQDGEDDSCLNIILWGN